MASSRSSAKIGKSNWMKNLGKSVAFSSLNVLKEITPNISGTAISMNDSLRDIRKFIATSKNSLRSQERMLEATSVGRTVKDIYDSAINDIKTGNFSLNKLSDDALDSFGDMDFDFGDSDSSSNDSIGGKSAAIIGKTVANGSSANIDAMREMTNVLSKTQLKSAKLMSDKSTDITLFGINKINSTLMGVNSRLDAINSNLVSMIRFQNENVSITNQAMLQYFDKSLEILNRIDKSMNMSPSRGKKNDFSDMFMGGFNLKRYGQFAKKNFDNSLYGSLFNMGKMIFSMGSMMDTPRLPKFLLESAIKMAIPKGVKSSIGSLDRNSTRYIQNMLTRVGDLANDHTKGDITRFLGEIFGVKRTKVKSVNMGDYNKEALSWNGVAQKALTEVIPAYLAKIEQNTSKNNAQARHYDYETGRFKTRSQIAKEYRGDREMIIQSGMSGSVDKLLGKLNERNMNPNQIRDIQNKINKLINDRLKGKTNYDSRYRNSISRTLGNSLSRKDFRELILSLEDELESTMGRLNRHSSSIERDIEGSVYRNLFNTHGSNTSRYNGRVNAFGLRGSLGAYGGSMGNADFTRGLADEIMRLRRAGASESEIRRMVEGRNNSYSIRSNIRNRFSRFARTGGERVSGFIDYVNDRLFNASMGFSMRDEYRRRMASMHRYMRGRGGRVPAIHNTGVNDNMIPDDTALGFSSRRRGGRRDNSTISRALRSFRGFSYRNTMDASNNEIERDVRDTSNMMDIERDSSQRIGSILGRNRNTRGASSRFTNSGQGRTTSIADAISEQSNSLKSMIVSLYNSFLRPMVNGLFGKNGFIRNMWGNSTAKKAFGFAKDKLFDENSGIFGGVTRYLKDSADYMKYVFTGKGYRSRSGKVYADKKENSVFGYLKQGYQMAFTNTMKFLFNDDYKENDWYKKYFSWMSLDKKKKDKKKSKRYTYSNKSTSSSSSSNGTLSLPPASTDSNTVSVPVTSSTGKIINENYDTNDTKGIQSAMQRNVAVSTAVVSNRIQSTGNKLVTTMMGDPDQSDAERERGFLKRFKSNLPKMLAAGVAGAGFTMLSGGSMGVLGSLFLPGGPIGGALMGMGLQLLSRSESFQNFIFGEYDPKENKRVGGIISQRMQNSFKKALPIIVGGATLGGIKTAILGGVGQGLSFSAPLGTLLSTFLPGGIIGGALMGMATSLVINNQRFREILFGQKDENGKRRNGIFAKAYNAFGHKDAKANKMFKGAIKGAGAGAFTALTMSHMGLIPAALSFGGPIGGAIVGLSLGIASQGKRFQEMLFGTEEIGPDGKPTGKRNRDGFLSQIRNSFVVHLIDPLKKKTEDTMTNFAIWAKKQILFPFRLAFGPLADAVSGLKDSVGDFLKEKIGKMTDRVGSVLITTVKGIFSPITRIMGFIGKKLIGAIATTTKIALSPVTGTLKVLSALTAPKRAMEEIAFRWKYRKAKKQYLGEKWAKDDEEGKYSGPFSSIRRAYGHFKERRELNQNEDVADIAREKYNETLGYSGENHFGWRNVRKEKKILKSFKKDTKEEQKKWDKIYNLRQSYAKEDKNKESLWSRDKLKKRQDEFAKLGIERDKIRTEKDVKDLIYRIDDWKDKYTDQSYNSGMKLLESPEAKQARIQTAVYQNTMQDAIIVIRDIMQGKAHEHAAKLMRGRQEKRRKKYNRKLERRLKRYGMSLKDVGVNNYTDEFSHDYGSIPDSQWDRYRESEQYATGDFSNWYSDNSHMWEDSSSNTNSASIDELVPDRVYNLRGQGNGVSSGRTLLAAYSKMQAKASRQGRTYTMKDFMDQFVVVSSQLQQNISTEAQIVNRIATGVGAAFSNVVGDDKKRRDREREIQETREAQALGDRSQIASAILAENVPSSDKDMKENTKKGSLLQRITSGVSGVFSGIFDWLSSPSALSKIGLATVMGSIFHKEIGMVFDKFLNPIFKNLFENVLPSAIKSSGEFLEKNKDAIGSVITSGSELMSSVIKSYGPTVINAIATNASAMSQYMVPALFKVAGSTISATVSVIKKQLGFNGPEEKIVSPEEARELKSKGIRSHMTNNDELVVPSNNTYYDKNNDAQSVDNGILGSASRLGFNSLWKKDVAGKAARTFMSMGTLPLKFIPGGGLLRRGLVGGAGYLAENGAGLIRKGIDNFSPKSIMNTMRKSATAYQLSRELGAGRIRSVMEIPKLLKQATGPSTVIKDGAPGRFAKMMTGFFAKLSEAFNSPSINNIVKEAQKTSKVITSNGIFSKIKLIIEKVVKRFTPEQLQKAAAKLSARIGLAAAKGGSKFIPVLGWGLVAYDVISGLFEADKLFGVDSEAVDWKMRFISSLLKGLLGLPIGSIIDLIIEITSEFSGVDLKQEIANAIYNLFPGDDDIASLKAAQDDFAQEADNYNNANKTNLSVMKYKELKNAPWYKRAWNSVTGKGNDDFSKYEIGKYKTTVTTSVRKTTQYIGEGSTPDSDSDSENIGNGPGKKRNRLAGYGFTKPKRMANFIQSDPRWANYRLGSMPDGSTSNMSTGGCGPTALSNVASSFGRAISPISVARFAKSKGYLAEGGSSSDLFDSGASQLGLKSTRISKGNLVSALKSGKPVIISGKKSAGNGISRGRSPFTQAGHIISASGIDRNGNTLVNDPMYGPRLYNIKNLVSGMTNGWMFNKKNIGYGYVNSKGENLFGNKSDTKKKSIYDDMFGELSTLFGNLGTAAQEQVDSFVSGKYILNTIKGSSSSYDSTPSQAAYNNKFGSSNEFFEAILPAAKDAMRRYNILPSLTLAQAALESGYGKSKLSTEANNIFGVKDLDDDGWNGPNVWMWTKEQDENGKEYPVYAPFRKYGSIADSIEDHNKVLLNSRYNKVRDAKNYKQATYEVRKAGYATDLEYTKSLNDVIEQYGLAKYDDISGYGPGTNISKLLNITSSNSYQKAMNELESEGYGSANDIANRLNVAVNTTGVENKLDILIHVMKTWAERDIKAQQSGNSTIISYNKGNSNKPPVVINTKNETPNFSGNNLREIHKMIAIGIRK